MSEHSKIKNYVDAEDETSGFDKLVKNASNQLINCRGNNGDNSTTESSNVNGDKVAVEKILD